MYKNKNYLQKVPNYFTQNALYTVKKSYNFAKDFLGNWETLDILINCRKRNSCNTYTFILYKKSKTVKLLRIFQETGMLRTFYANAPKQNLRIYTKQPITFL